MADSLRPLNRRDFIAELRRLATVEAECDRYREALEAIAATDDLVEANVDAFARHGFRRCQNIARNALGPKGGGE